MFRDLLIEIAIEAARWGLVWLFCNVSVNFAEFAHASEIALELLSLRAVFGRIWSIVLLIVNLL